MLTQCERLKLKNSLAAKRTGHSSVWFQPHCDPVTGHWSPVQCLGKQPELQTTKNSVVGRAFEVSATSNEFPLSPATPNGVCWCADKKGAPLKGTLTRDAQPSCNSRQARGRKLASSEESHDPLMEELIRQMTLLNDVDNLLEDDEPAQPRTAVTPQSIDELAITERALILANALLDSQLSVGERLHSLLPIKSTRCLSLAKTPNAPFKVDCDEKGAFKPTQCNGNTPTMCWCVDAAGNQLDASAMFPKGEKQCQHTPISSVAIELHMQNQTQKSLRNVYDTIRNELHQLLGSSFENLRVQENFDGSALVRFELHAENLQNNPIDVAYAVESAIAAGEFALGSGNFVADITRSHFLHRLDTKALKSSQTDNTLPLAVEQQATASMISNLSAENTIQLILFIMTSTAFVVSVFIVYIILKRGRTKTVEPIYSDASYPSYVAEKPLNNSNSDKNFGDFPEPIFVLASLNENDSIKPSLVSK